jgi:bifunctional DNA-binding transcriptional regulator/antitoxin component of YhaV-PrlF toxin-antitoxin module
LVPVIFRVILGKTGNSLRITLPRPIVEGFEWKEGDEIVLYVSEDEVTISKAKDKKSSP